MNLLGKWCLVTGAGSGIGRKTAEVLQAEGARLVLCDKDRIRMDAVSAELRSGESEVLSYGLDVSSDEQVEALGEWVRAEVGALDVLVNCAGVLVVGGCLDTEMAQFRQVNAVNLLGTVAVTKQFAPGMKARGTGAIINVASASGRVGFSQICAYSTSKFGVVGFSQALRAELMGTGVTVSAVCPGLVKTSIALNSGLTEEQAEEVNRLLEARGAPPEQIARAIVSAVHSGDALVSVGGDARAMEWLGRLFPSQASSLLRRYTKRIP